jgi:1,4-alpha-glucan branching enzyme
LLWLEEYRVDGLRFDATAFIRNIHGGDHDDNDLPEGWSMLQWLHEELQQRTPWKITIAEDLRNNEWVSREVGAGGMGFSTQWDPDFVHTVREAIIAPNDDARSPGALREALLHRYNGDAFQRVIYTESHDEVANGRARLPEEIWPGNVGSFFSKKRSTLGAALVLAAPGIPMLFQGQEFLEDRWFEDTDPLDWGRLKKYGGLAALYADLIRLRRNLEGTTRGLCGQNAEVTRCDEENKVLVMHRWDQGGAHDSVVVVANLANRALENYEVGFPAAGPWKVRLNSDWQGYDAGFSDHPSLDVTAGGEGRDGLPASAAVSIGPYSVVIYSLAE